jgi:hypothetical protein
VILLAVTLKCLKVALLPLAVFLGLGEILLTVGDGKWGSSNEDAQAAITKINTPTATAARQCLLIM